MTHWPLQTIAVCNQKGGVAKTTTTINLAAGLARKGYRVCVIDNDAQRNSSSVLGVDIHALPEDGTGTVIEIYAEAKPAIDLAATVEGRFDGHLSIISSHQMISGFGMQAETQVFQAASRGASFEDQQDMRLEMIDRLRESIKTLAGEFDVCIIDTPPALGFMLTAALRASDWLLVPLTCNEHCKDGVRDLMTTVNKVIARGNPRLRLFRALVGMYDSRKVLHRQDLEFYKSQFTDKLHHTPIKHGVNMEELASRKLSIFEHDPSSDQARQFDELADGFIEEVERFLTVQAERQAKREQQQQQSADVLVPQPPQDISSAASQAVAEPMPRAVGEG